MKTSHLTFLRAGFFAIASLFGLDASSADMDGLKSIVDAEILPVKQTYGIPGMAVAIIVDGNQYVFNYGVASKVGNKPVSNATMFEVGSISKTFTATLASLAQVRGKLSFNDKVSDHLNALKGSRFGDTTLLSLGTHTTGGLPQQVPDDVKTNPQLMAYLKNWQPEHEQGSYRTYSNISIGLLGVITAQSMQTDFTTLMQQQIFPSLGMTNSYLIVPQEKMADYAQGYTKTDAPVRMSKDVLAMEAYGVKTTASDLAQFLQANMDDMQLQPDVAQAIVNTHTGYFQAGPMTQSLIWESYPHPAKIDALLEGSSSRMAFEATPVKEITPPIPPRSDVLIHKTGSTNGFGAYIVFVPQKKIGVVILANKYYPGEARIRAAYQILTKLGM